MNIKVELIALDYHGTLSYRPGNKFWTVSPDVIETLIKAKRQGFKLAILTSGSGKTVPQNIRSLANILAFENGAVFHHEGKVYIYKPHGWDRIRKIFLTEKVKPKAVGRIILVYSYSVADKIEGIIIKHGLQDYINIIKNINRLVIAPRNTSKGIALRKIREILSIKGLVLGIGDGENDVVMLKEADISVAPLNAVDEIKKIAHYVCSKPNGYCVKEIIEKIIENKGLFKT